MTPVTKKICIFICAVTPLTRPVLIDAGIAAVAAVERRGLVRVRRSKLENLRRAINNAGAHNARAEQADLVLARAEEAEAALHSAVDAQHKGQGVGIDAGAAQREGHAQSALDARHVLHRRFLAGLGLLLSPGGAKRELKFCEIKQ